MASWRTGPHHHREGGVSHPARVGRELVGRTEPVDPLDMSDAELRREGFIRPAPVAPESADKSQRRQPQAFLSYAWEGDQHETGLQRSRQETPRERNTDPSWTCASGPGQRPDFNSIWSEASRTLALRNRLFAPQPTRRKQMTARVGSDMKRWLSRGRLPRGLNLESSSQSFVSEIGNRLLPSTCDPNSA